jgi:hypothetical protein
VARVPVCPPDLAGEGRQLFYEHRVGLGFLATVRPDGGPRVHPICPLVTPEGLYGFIVPGPKLKDLRRDSGYALHTETRELLVAERCGFHHRSLRETSAAPPETVPRPEGAGERPRPASDRLDDGGGPDGNLIAFEERSDREADIEDVGERCCDLLNRAITGRGE